MIIYLVRLRPFKSEQQQLIWVSDEFTIIFGLIALIQLFRKQDDSQLSFQLSLVIIGIFFYLNYSLGIIAGSLFKNLSVIWYNIITDIYLKTRKVVRKRTNYYKLQKLRREWEKIQRINEEKINRYFSF